MRLPCLVLLVLAAIPSSVAAQADAERRNSVFGSLGAARTLDDEGVLGTGVALGAGVGRRVTERLTIQGVVDRIPYHRDAGYLEFDGRVLYAGAEAAFRWKPSRVRPFVTIGAGIMHDRKRWIHRVPTGPGGPYRDESVTEHAYTLAAMRTSGGVEIRLSDVVWLRTGATLHGLLDTGDDLAAHVVLQPTAGLVWRW
jgi:hypothetical protein